MRLTVMTDYALRLMIYLAHRSDRRCTIGEVARAHGISETHLMKVTHQLGVQGWIRTTRGRGGGIGLARSPADISIGAVVRSIEPDFRLAECFGAASRCALTGQCRLAGILGDGLQAFFSSLDARTLADIAGTAPPPSSAPPTAPPAVPTRS